MQISKNFVMRHRKVFRFSLNREGGYKTVIPLFGTEF